MPYPKKYEKSTVRSVRIPIKLNTFLKEYFASRDITANEFLVRLIEETEEYQKHKAQKFAESSEPKLQLY